MACDNWRVVLVAAYLVGVVAVCSERWEGDSILLHRFERQAVNNEGATSRETCSGDSFRCTSGECIDKLNACDGTPHCSDQSDETLVACRNDKCPAYAFRCTYGACIDNTLKCDGTDDCIDQSDETSPECGKRCSDDQFECVTDETCIDELGLCDGKKDCLDGSDEAPNLCSNFSCPTYAFRCAYGGCIDYVGVCDGKSDCTDNSDEAPALCRRQTNPIQRPTTTEKTVKTPTPRITTTRKPTKPVTVAPQNVPVVPVTARPAPTPTPTSTTSRRGCILPRPPQFGSYNVSGCLPGDESPICRTIPGTPTPMSLILTHTCQTGYILQGSMFSVCQKNATWTPVIPTCVLRTVACPAIISTSVEITCTQAGANVNCSGLSPVGTEARLRCNVAYFLPAEPGYRKITCQTGGVWDRPLFSCVPECGKRNPNGRPFISNGEVAVVGEFPWHAGVYKVITNGIPLQVCGGTLISTRLVVSAAHCFWDEVFSRAQSKDEFKIALGKYYRAWNVSDSETQRFDIEELLLEERYRGRKRNFQFDIAVIKLKTEVELTWAVNIVCVDWDNDLESMQLVAGANGTVTGWGVTEENEPSDVLKSVSLPYVELFPTCYNTVMESFQPFLTSDKFCAGYVNRKTSVCPGDSGGGLVFQHSNSKRYFIRGVVSVGSKPETSADRCYTQQLTAFSKFSESRKWIEQYL